MTKKGAALADAPASKLRVEYQAEYKKAKFAAVTAKNKRKTAATEMFQFYTNLLSLDAKYAWNKIVKEQTKADPFKDLQGVSRKGSRGLLWESFNKALCFTFSLCFQTTQLSKKSITSPTCSRSPRGLGYISLYSA
jgi:hypothetical protein